jgi:hypothetical protein
MLWADRKAIQTKQSLDQAIDRFNVAGAANRRQAAF